MTRAEILEMVPGFYFDKYENNKRLIAVLFAKEVLETEYDEIKEDVNEYAKYKNNEQNKSYTKNKNLYESVIDTDTSTGIINFKKPYTNNSNDNKRYLESNTFNKMIYEIISSVLELYNINTSIYRELLVDHLIINKELFKDLKSVANIKLGITIKGLILYFKERDNLDLPKINDLLIFEEIGKIIKKYTDN